MAASAGVVELTPPEDDRYTGFPTLMPPSNRDGLRGREPRRPVDFRVVAGRSSFYREELVKHRRCLERQREYYSEKAIGDVEAALTRLISAVDRLCARENGALLVSRLLRRIDSVTRLSDWPDRKKSH